MNTFRQQLLNIRNESIRQVMEAHDTELRALLAQVDVDALRHELCSQAGRLLSHVEAKCRIPVSDFSARNRAYLTLKKCECLFLFYRQYPDIVLLLERLRAEFTGMVVSFDMMNTHFVFQVTGELESHPTDTVGCGNYSQRT